MHAYSIGSQCGALEHVASSAVQAFLVRPDAFQRKAADLKTEIRATGLV